MFGPKFNLTVTFSTLSATLPSPASSTDIVVSLHKAACYTYWVSLTHYKMGARIKLIHTLSDIPTLSLTTRRAKLYWTLPMLTTTLFKMHPLFNPFFTLPQIISSNQSLKTKNAGTISRGGFF